MWAEQLPSGHYRFTERYADPVTGEKKRVSVTLEKNTAQTRKLASEILRTKMYEAKPKPLTFGELCTLYLDDQSRTVKASTLGRNRGCLNVLKPILGENTASESITAGYIRKKLLDTGREAGTLNEWIKRLKSLFRWAYKNDYISSSAVVDKLDPFPDVPHRQKIEDKFIESSELSALLESMKNIRWKRVTEFLALSGLRFGEAAALLRSDVDLEHRVIRVTKNYDERNHTTTTPKTHSSIRDVYIQDELYDLCKVILFEDNLVDISGLFFCYESHHICYAAYRQYLSEISKKVIGRSITPHTLRHTHASLMMEAGMDVDSIAARLGHSNSHITREIYLHVTEKLKKQRNEAIKDVHIIG